MGLLDRYRKPGGFLQLLQLIETCGLQKRDKFLQMIEQEDPRWSIAIKDKMLTVEQIFSWDKKVVSDIVSSLQELTLAVAIHGFGDEIWHNISGELSRNALDRIEDLKELKNPLPAEISAAYIQIIEEVRKMVADGYIRLDLVDPKLQIPEDFEEMLDKRSMPSGQFEKESLESDVISVDAKMTAADFNNTPEAEQARKKIRLLQAENLELKKLITEMDKKLKQIQKLAS